jgi:transposase
MDRWHVIKNWREALEKVINRVYPRLKQRQEQLRSTPFPKRKKPRTLHEQAVSDASRERRLTRYEDVLACYQQGLPLTQIAKQLHVSRGTIYKYLNAEQFPERSSSAPSAGSGKLIAPYTTYLRERCAQGCQNAQQLAREIQAQGFSGNLRTVLRWLQAQGLFPRRYELRQFQDDWKPAEAKEALSLPTDKERGTSLVPLHQENLISPVELAEPLASVRQLSYLFVKASARLTTKDQQMLTFIQQEKELELAYRMTQQFLHLIKNKQGETAATWIGICSSCGISELEAFALGIQKELPAFQAACSLPYSNGMTEGFVNKLKHIKGSMYGRGSFELLRQRVLQSAA